MGDDLTATIASSLAMTYGSHTHPPQGGKDWKAAEDLIPVIDAEIRKAKAEALREAAEDFDSSTAADIHNAIGCPAPTYTPSPWRAAELWLHRRADQIEEDQ